MIRIEAKRVQRAGSTASEIAALAPFLAQALGGDPDTALASEAVEGLAKLARGLADDLCNMAEEQA